MSCRYSKAYWLLKEKFLMMLGLVQGEVEGSKGALEGQGWRGLLEGVCLHVNEQLLEALDGSQRLLAHQQQVISPS